MGKDAIVKNESSRTGPRAKQLVEKLEKLKIGDFIMTERDDDLYTFVLKPEHRGKILAVVGGRNKKVVAFGTRYCRVVKEARELVGNNFAIMPAPKKGVLYTR